MRIGFWSRLGTGIAVLLGVLIAHRAALGFHDAQTPSLRDSREVHLANVRQLTFGGQNAEAYFSSDGTRLTFQGIRDGYGCDQQFVMNIDGTGLRRISTGTGRTTCGWWMPGDERILFSSTHASSPNCPPKPDYSRGYVWPVYPTYRIYTVRPDGSDLRPLYPRHLKPGEAPGYNAESVVSRDGKRIVFTSDRGGDLDIWVMDIDGRHARQLTHTLGYDGGPWWSPDGKQICFRAYHPQTPEEIADYKALLKEHLIRPTTLDLYVMDADGTHVRQITDDRAANIANFAPSWTPDGRALVFASNRDDPQRRKFEIYKIDLDGTGLERITYGGQFDGFPASDRMASSLPGPRTATARRRTRPISSSPTGSHSGRTRSRSGPSLPQTRRRHAAEPARGGKYGRGAFRPILLYLTRDRDRPDRAAPRQDGQLCWKTSKPCLSPAMESAGSTV